MDENNSVALPRIKRPKTRLLSHPFHQQLKLLLIAPVDSEQALLVLGQHCFHATILYGYVKQMCLIQKNLFCCAFE